MSTALDWFNFAMAVRPYWLVLMTLLGVGLVVFAYAPRRRLRQRDYSLIPLRDDER